MVPMPEKSISFPSTPTNVFVGLKKLKKPFFHLQPMIGLSSVPRGVTDNSHHQVRVVVSSREEEGQYGDESQSESNTSGSRGRGNHTYDALPPSRLVSFETPLKRSGVGVCESDIDIESKKDVPQYVRNEAATSTSDLKDHEGITASRDDSAHDHSNQKYEDASFASLYISRMDLAQDCVAVMNPCASAMPLEGYVLLGLRDKKNEVAEHPYRFPLGYVLPAGSEVTVWCSPGVSRFDATRLVAPYLLWTNADTTLRSSRVLDPHGDGMALCLEDRTGRRVEVSTLALTADGKVSRLVDDDGGDDDDASRATENVVECDDDSVREGGLPAASSPPHVSCAAGKEPLMGRYYGSYTQPLQLQPATHPSSSPSPVSTAAPASSVVGEVVPVSAHPMTARTRQHGRGISSGDEEDPSEQHPWRHSSVIDDNTTVWGPAAYAAKTNVFPPPPPLHTKTTWQHPIGPLHPPIMWGDDANDNDSIADMRMSPETSMRSSSPSPPGNEADHKKSEHKAVLTSGGETTSPKTSNTQRMQSLDRENSPSSRVQRYDLVARRLLPLDTDEVWAGGIRSNQNRIVSNEQRNYRSSQRQEDDAENLSYAWGSPSSRVQRYDSVTRLPLDTDDEVRVGSLRWSQHRTIPNNNEQYKEQQDNDGDGGSSRTDADNSAYFAWGHSANPSEVREQHTSESASRAAADPDQRLMVVVSSRDTASEDGALGNLRTHDDRDSYGQKSDSSSASSEGHFPSRLLPPSSGFQDVFWDEEQSIHSDIQTVSKDSGTIVASSTSRAEQGVSKPMELRDDVEDVSVLSVLKQKVCIPYPLSV